MLVSVDPGLNGCGVAVWLDNTLSWAGYIKNPGALPTDMVRQVEPVMGKLPWSLKLGTENPVDLAIELPQVYTVSKSKGDPNDLINLAVVVGAFLERWSTRGRQHVYSPGRWKGQVPKLIMVERIQKRLRPDETASVDLPAKSLAHNVWDAVGIGLYHLDRLKDRAPK